MNNELKPCPFCGGKAKLLKFSSPDKNMFIFTVQCTQCTKTIAHPFTAKKEAIKTWNSIKSRPKEELLVFKACPICNHAPLVKHTKIDKDREIYMVSCPKCFDDTCFVGDALQVNALWNAYASNKIQGLNHERD